MDCDQASPAAYIRAPGHTQPVRARTPAEQLARFGVLSEAFGAGVVLGELFCAALSAQPQSRRRTPPGPARFRQPGHPGGALAAAQVSWEGAPHPGGLPGFPP